MDIYLVGGAVRDQLLQLPVNEQDWVVVGASAQQMMQLGYQAVGKDFPVFLHPQTHEEYALARTEKKTAAGYKGFVFQAAPDVSLEQDLARRDLTINAMAQDNKGNIIDPFGGQDDLNQRILRHVSAAFVEDPVRILRIARFLARFAHLGFTIADETMLLMRKMVTAGEVDALVADRVWKEWRQAFSEQHPELFISTLRSCGALARLLPELDNLADKTRAQGLQALMRTAKVSSSPKVRFATLMRYLGINSTQLINNICSRYPVPKDYRELAHVVASYHQLCHQSALTPEETLKLLTVTDAFRRKQRLDDFLLAVSATKQQTIYLQQALAATSNINIENLLKQNLSGQQIKQQLYQLRLATIKNLTTL